MLRSRFDPLTVNSPLGRGWGWVADEKTPHMTTPTPCPSQEGNCRQRRVTSISQVVVISIFRAEYVVRFMVAYRDETNMEG